jgi:hypothetical protein
MGTILKAVLLSVAVALLNVAVLSATPAAPEHRGGAESVYIEDLTWPEVKASIAAGKTTAIIYAGSTEQNGGANADQRGHIYSIDKAERRGNAPAQNECSLSRSSIPSMAQRRRGPAIAQADC